MKIKMRRRFQDDYDRIQKRIRNPLQFRKAFFKVLSELQVNGGFSAKLTSNRIAARGEGWYDCYVCQDIIMIYKVEGQYIKLSRLGTPGELEKSR